MPATLAPVKGTSSTPHCFMSPLLRLNSSSASSIQTRQRHQAGRKYFESKRVSLKSRPVHASASGDNDFIPRPDTREEALRSTAYGYNFFAALAITVFVLKQVAPQVYLSLLYRVTSPTPAQLSAVRISSFALFPLAAVFHSLKEATLHDRLRSATYGRLNIGIVLFSIGYFIYSLIGTAMDSLSMFGSLFAGLVSVVALNLAVHGHLVGTGTSPIGLVKDFWEGLSESVKPRGRISGLYAASAVALFAWGVGLVFLPQFLSVAVFLHQGGLGVAGNLIWISEGACLLMAAVSCLVLKDASERGRLGASTFRSLNLGLAAMSVGTLGVMVLDLVQATTTGCACCQTGLWQGVTSYWAYPAIVMLSTFLTSSHSLLTAKA